MSSGSVMFLGGDDEGRLPTPIRELYAVFRRPARPADRYVQRSVERDMSFGPDQEDDPSHVRGAFRTQLGTPLYHQTRLLVGTAERGVYAVPTTAGAISLGWFPGGGSGCGQPGPHGLCIHWDGAGDRSPLRVYGIVGDDVAGVDLFVGGTTRSAELHENGYLLQLADTGSGELEQVVLHLHSGDTDAFTLPRRPRQFG